MSFYAAVAVSSNENHKHSYTVIHTVRCIEYALLKAKTHNESI